jgi:hypothetical protein
VSETIPLLIATQDQSWFSASPNQTIIWSSPETIDNGKADPRGWRETIPLLTHSLLVMDVRLLIRFGYDERSPPWKTLWDGNCPCMVKRVPNSASRFKPNFIAASQVASTMLTSQWVTFG